MIIYILQVCTLHQFTNFFNVHRFHLFGPSVESLDPSATTSSVLEKWVGRNNILI